MSSSPSHCSSSREGWRSRPSVERQTRQLAPRSRFVSRLPVMEECDPDGVRRGPSDADIMSVGEQPGDREDIQGRPFVGPAALLLDRALAEAGVDRGRVYVTNAVKHFKFEPRGKPRLHKRPNASEIKICRRWLLDEIEAVGPRLIVALGVTAARSLAGRAIPISEQSRRSPRSRKRTARVGHDRDIRPYLPGGAPTGRKVVLPHVAVMGFDEVSISGEKCPLNGVGPWGQTDIRPLI